MTKEQAIAKFGMRNVAEAEYLAQVDKRNLWLEKEIDQIDYLNFAVSNSGILNHRGNEIIRMAVTYLKANLEDACFAFFEDGNTIKVDGKVIQRPTEAEVETVLLNL